MSSGKITIIAAMTFILLVGLLGWYFIAVKLGAFATETEMQSSAYLSAKDCAGYIDLSIEIKETGGKKVPNANISLLINRQADESLLSDQNGKLQIRKNMRQDWCGKEVIFDIIYSGDDYHKGSAAAEHILIKEPTQLAVSSPEEVIEGENVRATAILRSKITGNVIGEKQILLGNLSNKTGGSGIATFTLSFNKSGTHNLRASFDGDERFEASNSEPTLILVSKATCADGTRVGACSGQFMCLQNRTLKFSCVSCGCPANFICSNNECISE